MKTKAILILRALLVVLLFAMVFIGFKGSSSQASSPLPAACKVTNVCNQVPKITITLPPQSQATKTIIIPGPKETVIKNRPAIPLPRKTVIKRIPGPTVTKRFTTAPHLHGSTVRTETRTVEVTPPPITVTPSPVPTVTATETVSTTVVQEKEKTVTVTVRKAVGISLLLLLVGAFVAAVVMYMMYAVGYLKASQKGLRLIRGIRNPIRR